MGSFTTGFRITTFILMGIVALWAFYAVMILIKSFTKFSNNDIKHFISFWK